jgi:hypothetical protein
VITQLEEEISPAVSKRFHGVLDARREKAAPSVETSRERVEAELVFEKYVLEISTAIGQEVAHQGRGAAPETEHAH